MIGYQLRCIFRSKDDVPPDISTWMPLDTDEDQEVINKSQQDELKRALEYAKANFKNIQ